jgi:hypothetical protein
MMIPKFEKTPWRENALCGLAFSSSSGQCGTLFAAVQHEKIGDLLTFSRVRPNRYNA